MLLESCVDSLDSALSAARGGAGRIELCANLDADGTTPDLELIAQCAKGVSIPVSVLIRPRPGNFVYDAAEASAMEQSIHAARAAGARGIVVGALTGAGDVARQMMRRFCDAAHPLPVTFHRAIDVARDLIAALDVLIAMGVARVLTSGGAPTALEGANTIAGLVARAGNALTIIAGGGVRAHNAAELVRRTGVREVHARVSQEADVAALVRAIGAAHKRTSVSEWPPPPA
jgi:copper homeostasis protein